MSFFSPDVYLSSLDDNNKQRFDAFGRLRVSNPHTIFESQMQFDDQPVLWETITTGNGSTTHIPYQSSLELNVTQSGDKVIRQTYEKFRYQPGKSQLIFMTGVLNTNSGSVKRIGYFNDTNGIYYEQHPTEGVRFVIRTNSGDGSTIEYNYAPQSTWNIDTFDDLDVSKSFILVFDFEWLGMGTVRVGYVYDGGIRYVHAFHHANKTDRVYMATANLPARYEIEYISGADTLKQTCTTVISEGGYENKGMVHYVDTGSSAVSVGSEVPLISIKLKDSYSGAQIIPEKISLMQTSNSNTLRFRVVVHNGLTNEIWNSVGSTSAVEYDTSATSSSGGITLDGGYLPPKSPSPLELDFSLIPPICSSYDGTPTVLSIIAEGIGGTVPVYVGIKFRELK